MTPRPPRATTPRPEPPRAHPQAHRATSRSTGTSSLDPVMDKLRALGLEYPAQALPALVEEGARDDLSPLAFLDLLLTGQLERKDERARRLTDIEASVICRTSACEPARRPRVARPAIRERRQRTMRCTWRRWDCRRGRHRCNSCLLR